MKPPFTALQDSLQQAMLLAGSTVLIMLIGLGDRVIHVLARELRL